MSPSRISQLAVTSISLLLLGCQDSITFPDIIIGSARIRGQVIGASGPAAGVSLTLASADPSPSYNLRIYARADDDGRFDIAVPPGSFLLDLAAASTIWYSADGPTMRRTEADTLRVREGQGPLDADFRLGGLTIRVRTPAGLEGQHLACDLSDGIGAARLYGRVESGEVTFVSDLLPPGVYTTSVEGNIYARGEMFSVWLPATLDSSQADRISVRSLRMTTWESSLPEPGHLKGVVRGWEELVEGEPSIEVYGPDSTRVATQDVDDAGGFAIPIYAEGRVRIRTEVGGNRRWHGGERYLEATEYPISPGATSAVDTIRASGIVGHLIGDPAWQPFEFSVLARDQDGNRVYPRHFDDDRTFALANIRPGVYLIGVSPEDGVWRPQWYDRRRTSDDATPVIINREGEIIHIDVILEEGGTISGRVIGPTGAPAVDQLFYVGAVETGWYWDFRWITRSDGSFELEGLPDDDIIIAVRGGSATVWYPGTYNHQSAVPIPIRDAGHVTGIEFRLPR